MTNKAILYTNHFASLLGSWYTKKRRPMKIDEETYTPRYQGENIIPTAPKSFPLVSYTHERTQKLAQRASFLFAVQTRDIAEYPA